MSGIRSVIGRIRQRPALVTVLALSLALIPLTLVQVFVMVLSEPVRPVELPEISTPTDSFPCGDTSAGAEQVATTLTAAVQAHDRDGFVSLVSEPGARQRMLQVWDNLDALGFTTGVVANEGTHFVNVDPTVQLTLRLAVHQEGDGTTQREQQDLPNTPGVLYRATMNGTAAEAECTWRITDWNSIGQAPWDAGRPLRVVKAGHVVVAGPPASAEAIDRILPVAERASAWVQTFFSKQGQPFDETAFTVFVASTDDEERSWFRIEVGQQPDSVLLTRRTGLGHGVLLSGGSFHAGGEGADALSGVGGARLVLGPSAGSVSEPELSAALVNLFTHAAFADEVRLTQGVGLASKEGGARFVEDVYRADPAGYEGDPRDILGKALRPQRDRLNGTVPTDDQFAEADSAELTQYYIALSASTYEYIRRASTMANAVKILDIAYCLADDPLTYVKVGNVPEADRPAAVRKSWDSWVRTTLL